MNQNRQIPLTFLKIDVRTEVLWMTLDAIEVVELRYSKSLHPKYSRWMITERQSV